MVAASSELAAFAELVVGVGSEPDSPVGDSVGTS